MARIPIEALTSITEVASPLCSKADNRGSQAE